MNEKKVKPNFSDLGRLFKIVRHIVINNMKVMKLLLRKRERTSFTNNLLKK